MNNNKSNEKIDNAPNEKIDNVPNENQKTLEELYTTIWMKEAKKFKIFLDIKNLNSEPISEWIRYYSSICFDGDDVSDCQSFIIIEDNYLVQINVDLVITDNYAYFGGIERLYDCDVNNKSVPRRITPLPYTSNFMAWNNKICKLKYKHKNKEICENLKMISRNSYAIWKNKCRPIVDDNLYQIIPRDLFNIISSFLFPL